MMKSFDTKNLRHRQLRTLRSALAMLITMLAIPLLLSACGQSEWREVKAPVVAQQAKPAELPAPPVATPPAPAPLSAPAPTTRRTPPKPLITSTSPKTPQQTSPRTIPTAAPARVTTPPKSAVLPKRPVSLTPSQPPSPVQKEQTIVQAPIKKESDRYIMIQNIATEKLRVYERATIAGAPHRLIFETDMIAGENNPATTRRTLLGSYVIEKWIKFYQDSAGLFPSWIDPKLEAPPLPGAELEHWTAKYLMPQINGKTTGLVRGAFGWYTAKIGPNAQTQWTHGTVGWGADKGRFIQIPKTQLAQFYGDPRSFGCTRVENRAIAYLQDLLPIGTRVLKVYAKEGIADPELLRYKNQKTEEVFEFALSTDEVRVENPNSISRANQILRGIPDSAVIEEGIFTIDSHPDAVQFKKTYGEILTVTRVTPQSNLYDIKETSFHGEFLVDEGRFVNYKHPSELRLGGFKGQTLPAVVIK